MERLVVPIPSSVQGGVRRLGERSGRLVVPIPPSVQGGVRRLGERSGRLVVPIPSMQPPRRRLPPVLRSPKLRSPKLRSPVLRFKLTQTSPIHDPFPIFHRLAQAGSHWIHANVVCFLHILIVIAQTVIKVVPLPSNSMTFCQIGLP